MAEKKKGNTTDIVYGLAKPFADELGLSIWDVQFIKEGADWFLRIFIDKPEGINIDDCVNLTRLVNPVLDSEDPISQEYTFEVSSCGINRKLTKPQHFQAMLEAAIKVRLIRPAENGQREFEGILIEADDSGNFEMIVEEDLTVSFNKKECSWVILLDDDF